MMVAIEWMRTAEGETINECNHGERMNNWSCSILGKLIGAGQGVGAQGRVQSLITEVVLFRGDEWSPDDPHVKRQK